MLTRITTVALICLTLCPAAVACINTFGTDLDGRSTQFLETPAYLVDGLRSAKIDRERWVEVEARLSKDLETADYKHRTDYAAALVYLGRYEEAITILEEVEQQHPGEYIVATNLGTAYELSGNLERALFWIQKCLERNPESHDGTEWLHVKILEAKLQLDKDPDWLKTHSVLGLDLGRERTPAAPAADFVDSQGNPHDLEDIRYAIEHQLGERLKFVSPQDAVVGDLLFDLGNILALTSSVEEAVPVYEFAEEYGVQNPSLVETRKRHFQELAAANPQSGESGSDFFLKRLLYVAATVFGILVVVCVVVAYFAYRQFTRSGATVE